MNLSDKALEYARRVVHLDLERFKSLDKKIVVTATHEARKKYLATKKFAKAPESFSESAISNPTMSFLKATGKGDFILIFRFKIIKGRLLADGLRKDQWIHGCRCARK
jgi:hypothetical protein